MSVLPPEMIAELERMTHIIVEKGLINIAFITSFDPIPIFEREEFVSQIPQIMSEVNMGNSMRPDSITIKDMDKTSDLGIKKQGSDDFSFDNWAEEFKREILNFYRNHINECENESENKNESNINFKNK